MPSPCTPDLDPQYHPASGRIVACVLADVGESSTGLYGVFAAQPGGGRVAGIVLTREPLPADLMQRYVLQRRQRGEIGRRRQLAMRGSTANVASPDCGPLPER